MEYVFNVAKKSSKKYLIQTTYNKYTIVLDATKGTGIYMNLGDDMAETLIKTYDHCNIMTSINYLWKKEMF